MFFEKMADKRKPICFPLEEFSTRCPSLTAETEPDASLHVKAERLDGP